MKATQPVVYGYPKTVVKEFATERDMRDWLMNEAALEEMKAQYPPPRYSADVDLITRQIIVTDKEDKS